MKRRLDRQKSILTDKANFTKEDQEAYEQILANEIDKKVDSSDQLQTAAYVHEKLKIVLNERFVGTKTTNKVEKKTLKLLLDETIRQVKVWSANHGELIMQILGRQDQLATERLK